MLNWIPAFDGNRPVLGFIVYIRDVSNSDGDVTMVANITVDEAEMASDFFSYNISGVEVQPFTMYAFRVVSCNDIGCSNESLESSVVQTEQYSEY